MLLSHNNYQIYHEKTCFQCFGQYRGGGGKGGGEEIVIVCRSQNRDILDLRLLYCVGLRIEISCA